MNATSTNAPLTQWKIIGFEERWHCPAPDVKQPGGTCWYCGTAIAHCVKIQHLLTGQREIIGSTCMERVGLTKEQLREHLSRYYADRRTQEYADHEAALAAQHGEHGTQTRFESGCYCRPCREAAPHGTADKFRTGCRCLDCIDASIADGTRDYWIDEEYPVIVDLSTGRIANAEIVDGRYGRQWKVRANGYTVYLALSPARRTTHSRKGFVEASAPMLVTGGRGWHTQEMPLGSPLADRWGQPIPHPAS